MFSKIPNLRLTVPLSAVLCFLFVTGLNAGAATPTSYFVSPSGNDSHAGTLAAPFRTIARARDVVRRINGHMTGDIHVYLRGGTYFLTSPVQFSVIDGGTNGHQVIYRPYLHETPVISGAAQVTGWTVYKGDIYKATLDRDTKLRSLIVNGVRARMTASKDITVDPATVATWGSYPVMGTEPWAQTSGNGF